MMMLTIGVIFSCSVIQLFSCSVAYGLWPMTMARFNQKVKLKPFSHVSHGPLAIGHSFERKNSFFSYAVDPIEAFCIFVSP
jgi:hypothetical protein